MLQLRSFILLIRIHQWTKNFFIFLPAFFAFKIVDQNIVYDLILTFFGFSFLASAIYVFNDMLDIESDKLHPTKKNRPLASGVISKNTGIILIICLLIASFAILSILGNSIVIGIASIYLVQNILYTVKLKHIALVDIMLIATGFVLRIYIGGEASNTQLSHWIILMTLVLALFLALAKRRDDVFNYLQTGQKARKNLNGYNMEFLNVAITIMSTIVIVCYVMYCTSPEVTARLGNHVYLTSFFVILGVLRYLQLTFVWYITGSPTTVLLKNAFLQIILIGWIISFFLIIYLKF